MARTALLAVLTAMLMTGGCMEKKPIKSASEATAATSGSKPEQRRSTSTSAEIAPTLIGHQPTFEKILGNSGITLQWLSWESQQRGALETTLIDGTLWLKGGQKLDGQPGSLQIDGRVVAVSEEAFTFSGVIKIIDTPDIGRNCVKEGMHNFAITQNRKYFRLREFEWCDSLTDYVDIYF